jgi:predicted dehydrogenase
MQSSRSYSIALVGLGHRGYGSHFKSLFGDPSNSIVAVCDTNHGVLDTFSNKHPDVPSYTSVDRLLQSHTPDFAILSVPHAFHMDCVVTLSNNKVPILKEKPVAESMEEFIQMSSLPVKIGVTFQKRYEPQFIHLMKLLPLVGDVAAVQAKLTLNIEKLDATWRASSGVGTAVCLFSHSCMISLKCTNYRKT